MPYVAARVRPNSNWDTTRTCNERFGLLRIGKAQAGRGRAGFDEGEEPRHQNEISVEVPMLGSS